MYSISTIMPSFLGNYENAASNRNLKFVRAVDSWIKQVHNEKELIIVSDGCQITNELYHRHYQNRHNIKLVQMEKQPLFSGNVRQAGINNATGDYICYLDSDDYFLSSHLSNIDTGLNSSDEPDWCMFNDLIKTGNKTSVYRNVILALGHIGTSNIAHKRNLQGLSWVGCDGYNHDWSFIQRLRSLFNNNCRIFGCGYVVCHIPNKTDL